MPIENTILFQRQWCSQVRSDFWNRRKSEACRCRFAYGSSETDRVRPTGCRRTRNPTTNGSVSLPLCFGFTLSFVPFQLIILLYISETSSNSTTSTSSPVSATSTTVTDYSKRWKPNTTARRPASRYPPPRPFPSLSSPPPFQPVPHSTARVFTLFLIFPNTFRVSSRFEPLFS